MMPPHSTSCAQPLLHRYALHSAGARTLHSRQSTLFYQQRRHSTAAGVKENDPKIVIYARILCIAIRSVSAKIWARTDSLLRFFNRRIICFQARFWIQKCRRNVKATGCNTKTHKTWELTATNQIMVRSCDVPFESVYREYERARAWRTIRNTQRGQQDSSKWGNTF